VKNSTRIQGNIEPSTPNELYRSLAARGLRLQITAQCTVGYHGTTLLKAQHILRAGWLPIRARRESRRAFFGGGIYFFLDRGRYSGEFAADAFARDKYAAERIGVIKAELCLSRLVDFTRAEDDPFLFAVRDWFITKAMQKARTLPYVDDAKWYHVAQFLLATNPEMRAADGICGEVLVSMSLAKAQPAICVRKRSCIRLRGLTSSEFE
jgi:hypothetical protein